MIVNFTEAEINLLNFYLKKALIDARGLRAIGIGRKNNVTILEGIQKKLITKRRSRDE